MGSSTRPGSRQAGYAHLVAQYELDVVPNWHTSHVFWTSGTRTRRVSGQRVEEHYPTTYWPGNLPGDHLEFALKYDGTNLGILGALFDAMPEQAVLEYVRSKPTGKYARRVWYLYELLTGRMLEFPDLTQGNYVPLLDPEEYYTAQPRRSRRQRIDDNLLGDARFCPMIRRTERLRRATDAELPEKCREVVQRYSPDLVRRALSYLYTKETKSSFAIEHESPDTSRTERFVALLASAESEDFCNREGLVEVQNQVVDPRFRETDYRTDQNYVGQTAGLQKERIHFVPPTPEAVPQLMDGLIAAHDRMGTTDAVVHAAAVSYGFVFIHPFDDGNGRIHRFLVHNVLARRGFTPPGLMFPISAAMLRAPADYDASLEAFSRPLMSLVEYSLDDEGRLTVHNDITPWYRFIDLTVQTEALFDFIERTIETDLPEELEFLDRYYGTKRAMQEVVDLPDQDIDLFIKLCLQNRGRLAKRKRDRFAALSDDEISCLEAAVQAGYGD